MTTLHSPAKSERTAAAAVHVGAIFAPIWVPLIAYVVTHRTKKFIAEHARQSLTETLILNVCIGAAMVGSFCYTVWRVWSMYQEGFEHVDWGSAIWQTLLRMGIWWLLMGILWIVNFFVSLRQASQALNGEWPRSTMKRLARSTR